MEHNFPIKTYMAIMAERDAAIRERNMALDERRRAFAERDMAMLQRDAAVAERNSAVEERDKALAALEFRESSMNENNIPPDAPGDGTKHLYLHQQQHMQSVHHFAETASNAREIPTSDPFQSENVACEAAAKPRKVKQTRETKGTSTKKNSKYTRKGEVGAEGFSQVTVAIRNGWENVDGMDGNSEDLDGQFVEYKDNLGLNQVNFDESTMPVPVCTCTGVPQPCYKWGNGGWQSACCTTTMSMYPLPQMSNKRHSRVGGRKMSGGAFNKLLNRLVAEDYDLYNSPLDLKDHWAKHGTNRYSTLK